MVLQRRPRASLSMILAQLDAFASPQTLAEAVMVTAAGTTMVLRAGGAGTVCWPQEPPYENYEVLYSGKVPRLWQRHETTFSDVYEMVPRLMVTDLLTQLGGVTTWDVRPSRRVTSITVRVAVETAEANGLIGAMRSLAEKGFSARVLGTHIKDSVEPQLGV